MFNMFGKHYYRPDYAGGYPTLALIDADILVYEAAFRNQESFEWEEGEFTEHANLPAAQQDFDLCVEGILESTRCTRAILALTDSDRENNFRREIWPTYKESRDKVGVRRPLLYKALRKWIPEKYECREKPGIEADDTIGIMATGDINGLPAVAKRVICSVDKDLDTVPGKHYNWRKPENGVYEVSESLAFLCLMYQAVVGDSTDGYPGLPGVGKVRAGRMFESWLGLPMEDVWQAVVSEFEKKGLTEEDALVQARCARILQAKDWNFDEDKPVLWEPPGYEGD